PLADGEGPRALPESGFHPQPGRPVRGSSDSGHGRFRGRQRHSVLPNFAGRTTTGSGASQGMGQRLTHARLGRPLDAAKRHFAMPIFLGPISDWSKGMTKIVSVDPSGRIRIPKAIRELAGFTERTKLLVIAEEGRAVLQKLDADSLAARIGKELIGKDVDAVIRNVRPETRARVRKVYPDLSS